MNVIKRDVLISSSLEKEINETIEKKYEKII